MYLNETPHGESFRVFQCGLGRKHCAGQLSRRNPCVVLYAGFRKQLRCQFKTELQ
jgi:hypothetical protein